MIKAVIFDLDETLFDRTGSLKIFLQYQHKKYSKLASIDSLVFENLFLKLDRRGRVTKDIVYERLLGELNVSSHISAIELFHDYENNFWRYAKPFDGMDGLFRELKSRNLKTGIITNGQTHIQLRSLLALNLDRIVDMYLISESEQIRKPDIEIFQRAAKKLSVEINECAYVGDSPKSDILGASKAGMKTIWFPNGAKWPLKSDNVASARISSLSEISDIICDLS